MCYCMVSDLLKKRAQGPIVGMINTVQKATIHQVTTMLATSQNVLFPGHNHLLTTGRPTDDLTLIIARAPESSFCAVCVTLT